LHARFLGLLVATVATAVVLTGGAALVLVAGVKVAFVAICKSVAVGSYMAAGVLAISDIRSGNNSSYRDFFKVSITGAITGAYDPIGRRISKTFQGKTTKYLWDGDMIIHEYIEQSNSAEADFQAITWLHEDGSFIPIAKLTGEDAYSIVTDHIGTPTSMLDHSGLVVWNTTFNIWGREHQQTQSKIVAELQ